MTIIEIWTSTGKKLLLPSKQFAEFKNRLTIDQRRLIRRAKYPIWVHRLLDWWAGPIKYIYYKYIQL